MSAPLPKSDVALLFRRRNDELTLFCCPAMQKLRPLGQIYDLIMKRIKWALASERAVIRRSGIATAGHVVQGNGG